LKDKNIHFAESKDPVFCPLRSGAMGANHPLKGQMIIVSSGICLLEEEKECAFAQDGKCMIKKFLDLALKEKPTNGKSDD